LTPRENVARYTQAIMDLGATVCTRARPACGECPLESRCQGRALGRPQDFPAPRKARPRREREVWMLLARRDDGSVRLVQRPARGIWGGLWSPPEYASQEEVERAVGHSLQPMDELRHVFTHFDLVIRPLRLDVSEGMSSLGMDCVADSSAKSMWYNPARPEAIGLPAPVTALIRNVSPP
jgi:A/G-specific adenine glycosylase